MKQVCTTERELAGTVGIDPPRDESRQNVVKKSAREEMALYFVRYDIC